MAISLAPVPDPSLLRPSGHKLQALIQAAELRRSQLRTGYACILRRPHPNVHLDGMPIPNQCQVHWLLIDVRSIYEASRTSIEPEQTFKSVNVVPSQVALT